MLSGHNLCFVVYLCPNRKKGHTIAGRFLDCLRLFNLFGTIKEPKPIFFRVPFQPHLTKCFHKLADIFLVQWPIPADRPRGVEGFDWHFCYREQIGPGALAYGIPFYYLLIRILFCIFTWGRGPVFGPLPFRYNAVACIMYGCRLWYF